MLAFMLKVYNYVYIFWFQEREATQGKGHACDGNTPTTGKGGFTFLVSIGF